MTDVTMTPEQTLAALVEIVAEIADVPASEVTPEKNFIDDLEIDSLSLIEIMAKAEEVFGIDIKDEDVAGISTVGDVVDQIQKIRA
jgi:acyl carrier protein